MNKRNDNAKPTSDKSENKVLRIATTTMSEVKVKPVKWLIPNFVPKGMLTMLIGHGGCGKSSLLTHIKAAVSRGTPALGLTYPNPTKGIIFLYNCEDAPAEVLKPRLVAEGADCSAIKLIDGLEDEENNRLPFSLRHMEVIRQKYKESPFSILIIDPIASLTSNAGANDNVESEVRPLLEDLARFCEETKVTVICVKHLTKSDRESGVMRTSGSAAFTSVPRMVLGLTIDPNDPSRRILARVKENLPVTGNVGITFTTAKQTNALKLLDNVPHELDPDELEELANQMRVCTDFQTWDGDINEIMSGRGTFGGGRKKSSADKESAEMFLQKHLKNGPRNSKDCINDGNAELEFNYKLDWWRRVYSNMGYKPRKVADGWNWGLTNEFKPRDKGKPQKLNSETSDDDEELELVEPTSLIDKVQSSESDLPDDPPDDGFAAIRH